MGQVHGKGTNFQMDNASAALTDFSAFVNHVTVKPSVKTADTTVYGKGSKTNLIGVADAQITVDGFFDAASGAFDAALYDAWTNATAKNLQVGPEGTASGKTKWTGTFLLSAYSIKPTVDGVVPFTATFMATGDIAKGSF